MKKWICIISIVLISIILVSCGGSVSKVKIVPVSSDIYSSEEIDKAIEAVLADFKQNFDNCTLKEICYAGDELMEEEYRITPSTENPGVIVLSTIHFHNTYDRISGFGPEDELPWSWILYCSSKDNEWKIQDFGVF